MKKNKIVFTLIVIISLSGHLAAQSELEVEMGIFGGKEYNIFKSPGILLNRETMEPYPDDSILYSDYMVDVEYDINFSHRGKRSLVELGSDLWYRKYITYTDLDQNRMDANAIYQYFITDRLSIGGEYEFLWSNRIGTSVTGDLLMRSFKYLGNSGKAFLGLWGSEKLYMELFGEYEYKNYYDERTRDPLDHGNLEINYTLEYYFNNDNDIELELSWTDRNYFLYHSLDLNGDYDPINPLRNFHYYDLQFDYNWSPVTGLRINPGIEITRRIDRFEDYYSYMAYGGSMFLRYFKKNFYVSLYGDYKRIGYDIREAFTSKTNDPALIYGYYDMKLKLRYSISPQWEIHIQLESDNRSSNTDLEYFKTRRSYNNYQAMLGLTYNLPDIKW